MRPLRLRIKGLRSYRGELEIDFSEAGLFAVIGDTGSGKSSILEAMTYALYSATTWDQRGVGSLIADGAATVSVSLDFSAEGQIYRVTRSTSRTAYPPSVHKLECISEPELLRRDGQSAVTAEIERLVGLRYEAFISAVVLPQGRFDTLLRATPADRTAILKSIFRLHELEALREEARRVADQVAPLVGELEVQRRLLLEDPASEREKARAGLAAAEAEGLQVGGLRAELDSLANRHRELTETARKAEEERARLSKNIAAAQTTRYEALLELDATLRPLVAAAEVADAESAALQAQAELDVAEAERRGQGLAALTGHAATLETLARDLPLVASETAALELEASRLATDQTAQSASEARLDALLGDVASADATLGAAQDAETIAKAALDSAGALLEAYRGLEAEVATAIAVHDARTGELESASSELAEREGEEETARQSLEAANTHIDSIRRQHAAAHLAAGVGPGDPCPVCARKLPADFSPPIAADLVEAERDARHAIEIHHEAGERVTHARTGVATVRESLRLAQVAWETVRDRLATAGNQLADSLGAFDPRTADDELLAPLRTAFDAAIEGRVTAKLAADNAHAAANTLGGELSAARDALAQRAEAQSERQRQHADREEAVAARIATLPPDLRPGDEPGRDVASLGTIIEVRLADARALAEASDLARGRRETARDELGRLRERLRAEVERPRGSLRTAHAVLHASSLRAGTESDAPDAIDETVDLGVEASWAVTVRDAAARAVAALSEAAASAARDADACEASAEEKLATAGLVDAAELDAAIRRIAGDERVAREAFARAEREIPLAAELDNRLTEGTAFLATLRELASVLTDGTFIGHVVAQRQRALLAVSSEILGSVSSGRYGFSDDFQIVDRQSGQARSSRTLSGGETFQASLSLALGLVELAARSGGRLDALFLDEGFGALDTNALHEALTELERRASGGRLVGVVSHIRAVAEGIEQVLLVTRGSAGSQARWISRTERESEIDREIGEGLLV